MFSGYFSNVCVHVKVGTLHHLFHGLIFLISSHDFPQPTTVFTGLLMAAVRATRGHTVHVLHTSSCATHIGCDRMDSLQTGVRKKNKDLCTLPAQPCPLSPFPEFVGRPVIYVYLGHFMVKVTIFILCLLHSSVELNGSATSSLKNEIHRVSPCSTEHLVSAFWEMKHPCV